jgi:hypothetical protein
MKPRAIFKGSYIRKKFYNPGRKIEKKQDTQVYLILQSFNHKNTIIVVFNVHNHPSSIVKH